MSYTDHPSTDAQSATELGELDELAASSAVEHEIVTTLFDLGRQVTAVLELDDLLAKIPVLIGRLITFEAFAIYLLDDRRNELKVGTPSATPTATNPSG